MSDILRKVQEAGLEISKLAPEVGVSETLVRQIKQGTRQANGHSKEIERSILQRARRLLSFNPTRENFLDVLQECNIRKTALAKRLGVTYQALDSASINGMSEKLADRIKQGIRELGQDLLEAVRA